MTRRDAPYKLLQDHTDAERERIIADFRASEDAMTARMGDLMQERLDAGRVAQLGKLKSKKLIFVL